MLTPDYLRSKFDAGLPYADYLDSGSPHHRRGWDALHAQTELSAEQAERAALGMLLEDPSFLAPVGGVN